MLTLTIASVESFDEIKNEFVYSDETVIELEHSLVSLSKWESSFEKPFLGPEEKTPEETIGYIKSMTITPNVPSEVYQRLTNNHLKEINEYIESKHSATWFTERGLQKKGREIVTSELIYYWMVALNIPLECENWHLSRLFTFIKVVNQKNAPPKKMNPRDAAAQQRALNESRKAQYGTTG